MRRSWLPALLTGVLFALPQFAGAAGFESYNPDPLTLTRGMAANSRYNPSTLSKISGSRMSLGLNIILTDLEWQQREEPGQFTLANTVAATNPKNFTYNFAYTDTFGLDGFGFGIGLFSPYNYQVGWGDFSEYRYVTLESRLETYFYHVGASYSPVDWFGFGASVAYVDANFRYRQYVDYQEYVDQSNQNTQRRILLENALSDTRFGFDYDDQAISYFAGVWFEPIVDKLSIQLAYQSKTDLEFEGATSMERRFDLEIESFQDGDLITDPSNLFFDTTTSMDMALPSVYRIGVGYKPAGNVAFNFEVSYTQWEDLDDASYNSSLLDGDLFQFQGPTFASWENSLRVAAGIDYQRGVVGFRFGYAFDQNAIPDENLQGAVFDSDKHIASLGAGVLMGENSKLDFTYAHIFYDTRQIDASVYGDRLSTANTFEGVLGRYQDTVDLVSIMFTYQIRSDAQEDEGPDEVGDLFGAEPVDEDDEEDEDEETPEPEEDDDDDPMDDDDDEDDDDDLF